VVLRLSDLNAERRFRWMSDIESVGHTEFLQRCPAMTR
jgi:hypothetical protein